MPRSFGRWRQSAYGHLETQLQMEAKQHTVTSRMWLIPTPTKAQWRRLSLPQKLGCISAYFTVLSFVVVVLSFAWAIIFPGSKTIVRQKAETKGNNSPVIVTGPGATFNFPPAETMRKSVADALVSASKELDNKYPFG